MQKAVGQAIAQVNGQPGDDGEGAQRGGCQDGVDADQHHRGAHDHQHVGNEIDQGVGEKTADAIGIAADPGHQIACALGTEELKREFLQMGIGRVAQVSADALAHPGQHPALGPAESPGEQGRGRKREQVEPHAMQAHLALLLEAAHARCVLAVAHPGRRAHLLDVVLVRLKHLVDQGPGQVGRDQSGGCAAESE